MDKIYHEPHNFRLTLSFRATDGGVTIVVVSEDASIVYIMDASDHWLGEFKSGEREIWVQGYFDLLDNNIYLGSRIPCPL